jgi:hypothetical protein
MTVLTPIPQNSFKYRMGAGFPGDINRAHPASVEPVLNDATNPVLTSGLACVINATGDGVRQMAAGDNGVTKLYGIAVRAWPLQDPGTADNQWGGSGQGVAALPAGVPIDVMRLGYINTFINGAPKKNDVCYVWVAASAAPHIQGGFEAASDGGNTATIANAFFNGPPDANGYGEVIINQY